MSSPNSLREHRLRRSEQFEHIATKGRKVFVGSLLFKYVPSTDGAMRLAFIVRKKCGNAVFRNRVRRILRHQLYAAFPQVKQPVWAMVQFLGSSKDFSGERLHADADALARKLGWLP